jgi:hypothetical protein
LHFVACNVKNYKKFNNQLVIVTSKFATLSDDALENKAGWNPNAPNHIGGPDTYFFTIKDRAVNQNSIVYASVLGKQHFKYLPLYMSPAQVMDIPR